MRVVQRVHGGRGEGDRNAAHDFEQVFGIDGGMVRRAARRDHDMADVALAQIGDKRGHIAVLVFDCRRHRLRLLVNLIQHQRHCAAPLPLIETLSPKLSA